LADLDDGDLIGRHGAVMVLLGGLSSSSGGPLSSVGGSLSSGEGPFSFPSSESEESESETESESDDVYSTLILSTPFNLRISDKVAES